MPRSGFTLMEMLVTIGIIAIVAAISYPSLVRLQENSLAQQEATKVADLLQSAQERSLSEQQIYGVHIDPVNRLAQLITYGDNFNPNPNYQVVQSVVLAANTTIAQDTIQDATLSDSIVRFTASGLPSVTGYLLIANTHDQAHSTWRVEVKPAGNTQLSQS